MNADEIKTLINEALSYGYHVAKDEAKGIRSYGYASIFFARHDIKQKLQQHSVIQAEVSAFVEHCRDNYGIEIHDMILQDFLKYRAEGATVGQRSVDTGVSDGNKSHHHFSVKGNFHKCENTACTYPQCFCGG